MKSPLTPTRCGRRALIGAAFLSSIVAFAPAQDAAQEPAVRLIRSTSGTKGRQEGTRYVVDDPRATFSASVDRQVVVYFEWEGQPGLRHCEGRWKDPTGKVVLVAPVDYPAKARRFGIYWTLALPESVTPGLWALEATVDGEPAGTHTFEIRQSAVAAAQRLPTPAELYARAVAASTTVERVGASGEFLGSAPATAVGSDQLVVPFTALEHVASLRTVVDGHRLETQQLDNWDRRADWALVHFPAHGLTPLPPAEPGSAKVGDRCFVLDSLEDGSRVIGEVSIVGEDRGAGRRLRINTGAAAGSPVLDEHGRWIGVISAGSEASLGPVGIALLADRQPWQSRGSVVMPLELVQQAPARRPASLPELIAAGEFPRALSDGRKHVISGVFAAYVERRGAVPFPREQKFTFSLREGQASVFVQWNPKEKRDAQGHFEVYDADNKPVSRSPASKLKLRPGELFFSTWVLPLARLMPDVYRVDCLLDGAPVWRGYLRVTE